MCFCTYIYIYIYIYNTYIYIYMHMYTDRQPSLLPFLHVVPSMVFCRKFLACLVLVSHDDHANT
jgi:hypothetical protein